MGQQTRTVRHRWRISVTHDIRTSGGKCIEAEDDVVSPATVHSSGQ